MKVYVAGPMTGYPEWNFPAFQAAAEALRDAGHDVQSPHEFDLEHGFDPGSDGADFDLRAALERDVEAVLDADGVALLDGWEKSGGTVVEVLTAASQGKPARPLKEWLAGLVAALVAVVGIGVSTPAFSSDDRQEIRAATLSPLEIEERSLERRLRNLRHLPASPERDRRERWLKARLEVVRALS